MHTYTCRALAKVVLFVVVGIVVDKAEDELGSLIVGKILSVDP